MGAPCSEILIFPAIPRNAVEIRSKIRDRRRSLFNILPHPVIRKMDNLTDEHVYLLPSDCIQHFLAQGIMPLEFDKIVVDFPICRLKETPRGISIERNLNKV
jgi:hypothetical protein